MIIRALDNQLEISAPAKVNLFLELHGRRDDGFHEIETVMSSVSIFDRLRFTPRGDSEIRLSLSYSRGARRFGAADEIPTDQRNLVQKSIRLVRSVAQREMDSGRCTTGIDVHLEKTIPSAAGLGGASSDAAAALVAANRMWNLRWPTAKLCELGSQLGSDIAFFLFGGTAICRGRGEQIQPLNVPAGISIVVAKLTDSLSTAKVFGQVSTGQDIRDCSELTQSVRAGKTQSMSGQMFNRLQQFAEPLTDQIARLRHEFSNLNCLGHQMSGSGSSYFGVFPNARVARQAAQSLSSRVANTRIFCSQTLSPHPAARISQTG
jgi:4-diphosphocytidyl-2-C-methyl-D-erythritol kinase